MGKCTSCVYNQKKSHLVYDDIPEDINDYRPDVLAYKLPKLSFQGYLSNICIMNCSDEYLSVKFEIDQIIQVDLPRRRIQQEKNQNNRPKEQIPHFNSSLKWRCRQILQFLMDQYELRRKFLHIYVFDQYKKILTQLRINLFSIVIGPSHHDLSIKLSKTMARILFDLKLSQKIQAKLQIVKMRVQLNKEYLGEEFNFSLKQLSNGEVISVSKMSQPYKIPLILQSSSANYKQFSFQQENQSPTRMRRQNSHLISRIQGKSQIFWQNTNFEEQGLQPNFIKLKCIDQEAKTKLPHLKLLLKSRQINQSIVQLILWNQMKNQIDQLKKQTIMFSHCNFRLYKFFEIQAKEQDFYNENADNSTNFTEKVPIFKLQTRQFTLVQKLFSNQENLVGTAQVKLKLTSPKFFKQLHYCARTQDGVINMTPAFKIYGTTYNASRNLSIVALVEITDKIGQLTQKYSQFQSHSARNRKQLLTIQQQTYWEFQKMAKHLQKTLQGSFMLANASISQEMLNDQKSLLQILDKIYTYLYDENAIYTEICWKIVVLLLKRGEFYLENLGIFPQKDHATEQKLDKDLKRQKYLTCITYQRIVYKLLFLSLKSQIKDQSLNIKWAQSFKAYCYIRIPIFRKILLEILQKNTDQHLIQWKLDDFDSAVSAKYRFTFEKSTYHLDWKKYFYNPLQIIQQSKALDKQLFEVLQENPWIKKISNRQSQFFFFVGYLVQRLGQLGRNIKILQWKLFPGYGKVVRSFLIQMKKVPLKNMSKIMIQSSKSLLANDDLINILMPIVLQKANLYETKCVQKSFSLTWNYFSILTKNGEKCFPHSFNYVYFFKVLKLGFQCENSYSIGNLMTLIFKFFNCFNDEFQCNLTMYLLGKVFFKLFFHWSYTLRSFFQYFLLIKIYHQRVNPFAQRKNIQFRNKKQIIATTTTIKNRYQNIQIMLYNAEYLKKMEYNDELYRTGFKQFYKKMKKKRQNLINKKKRKESSNSIKTNQLVQMKQQVSLEYDYSLENLIDMKNQSLQKSQMLQNDRKLLKKRTIKYGISESQTNFYTKKRQKEEGAQDQVIINHGVSFGGDANKFTQKSMMIFDKDVHKSSSESQRSIQDYIQKNLDQSIQNSPQKKSGRAQTPQKMQNEMVDSGQLKKRYLQQKDKSATVVTKENKRRKYSNLKIQIPNQAKSFRASFTFFGNQDHQLQQITQNQKKQILISMKQFKNIQTEIEKYITEKNRLPEINLNAQVDGDGEFQPSSAFSQ